jgi:hypothetical protein
MFKELDSTHQSIYKILTKINDSLAFLMTRDNFSETTKRNIAMRVNWHCSNPTCGKYTIKPHSTDPTKYDILGDAAHINAASPNGPRPNKNMTKEEREHENNGIWLCQRCARIIDREPDWATEELLLSWKKDSELRALNNSIDEDKKQLIIDGIDIAINELNKFLDDYELNDPYHIYCTYDASGNAIISNKISFDEYNILSNEYASAMLRKYDKNVLPSIREILFKCRSVLGDSNKIVINVNSGSNLSNINKPDLRNMLLTLYDLKCAIAWR